MTKQEYQHIRNLAWDLLISARISQLPVDLKAIASLYNLQYKIDDSKRLYYNTIVVSQHILEIFGMLNLDLVKHLSVRILAPLIVFKELDVNSAEEASRISGLPINLANQRFNRLQILLSSDGFKHSNLESIVLSQFRNWIDSYHNCTIVEGAKAKNGRTSL